jgi:hypothetical protein
VKPLECSDPNDVVGSIYTPAEGSRYKEDFENEFSMKYDTFDPEGA